MFGTNELNEMINYYYNRISRFFPFSFSPRALFFISSSHHFCYFCWLLTMKMKFFSVAVNVNENRVESLVREIKEIYKQASKKQAFKVDGKKYEKMMMGWHGWWQRMTFFTVVFIYHAILSTCNYFILISYFLFHCLNVYIILYIH